MNNLSYEEYLKSGLMLLSKNFNVKVYKLANQVEWMGFERGKDLRIQIRWKDKCIWEWITERSLWVQKNTNKEDRLWMRKHADVKLDACKNALVKKKPNQKKQNKITKQKIGHTQECFERMKSK